MRQASETSQSLFSAISTALSKGLAEGERHESLSVSSRIRYIMHMGKTEIIEALVHLSPQDLAEVRERLEQLARDKSTSHVQVPPGVRAAARIPSPRLANPSQSRDFIKQVTELPAHAQV